MNYFQDESLNQEKLEHIAKEVEASAVKIEQSRKEIETRNTLRTIITSIAVILTFIALVSIFGLVIHADLVPNASVSHDILEKLSLYILLCGPVGISVFSGLGLVLWLIRARL